MWTKDLNKLDAFNIRQHVERLLELDDKINYLNPTEYNALCEMLCDVKNHIKEILKK